MSSLGAFTICLMLQACGGGGSAGADDHQSAAETRSAHALATPKATSSDIVSTAGSTSASADVPVAADISPYAPIAVVSDSQVVYAATSVATAPATPISTPVAALADASSNASTDATTAAVGALPAEQVAAPTGDAEQPVLQAELTTTQVLNPAAASVSRSTVAAPTATSAPANLLAPIAAGDAATPTPQVALAATLTDLVGVDPEPGATQRGLGPTAACRYGYTPPSSLDRKTAAALPARGGTFYTEAELATWRQRTVDGPFVRNGDHMPGSPGDWDRIVANAAAMLDRGEAAWTADTPYETRGTHGTLARDAAFHHLVTGNAAALAAVRSYLRAQARNPRNQLYTVLCITLPDGVTLDGYPHAASWLLRYAVTYDFVRHALPTAERVLIENFIRRNAYFMAAHVDWGIEMLFPKRQRGDYRERRADAAPGSEAATWLAKRHDTNGDCRVDDADPTTELPVYAFVRADGTRGPRISVLSQWYNNRKSATAAAVGAIGVLLGDANLIASAKRYVMEWLAYSVWPNGSQGEYARNGDYCIAQQGVIYSSASIQGAALLTRVLARHGDRSLLDFRTTTGLFGTASTSQAQAKSVEVALSTYVDLMLGRLPWHYDEAWKATPQPRAASALCSNLVRYLGTGSGMDDYHELGMLPLAGLMPQTEVDKLALRDPSVTALPFPGASGRSVPTGFGSWTDQFNAMPAMLLLRP